MSRMRCGVRWVCVLLILCACTANTPPVTTPLVFDASHVGGPWSDARAELYTPEGKGPFPAVVILHGCDGVGRHYRIWARQLTEWGYVAMLVDSFRPRGVSNICNRGKEVPPLLQAEDGFAAADYLRALPAVRANRIAVLGFSHGGWAVLKAVLSDSVRQAHARPFNAAVAFYPGCDPPRSPLVTDTLILIGDADDWTPVSRCLRWRNAVQTDGFDVEMKV